jgi:ATP-dependent Clp protease adaptor protein ClpS
MESGWRTRFSSEEKNEEQERIMSVTVEEPDVIDSGIGTDGVCQVVLYNDNHNTFDHVVLSLMAIFKHTGAIAKKVAMEAHTKGRAVAEVEDSEAARTHKDMLADAGLKAEVEKI